VNNCLSWSCLLDREGTLDLCVCDRELARFDSGVFSILIGIETTSLG